MDAITTSGDLGLAPAPSPKSRSIPVPAPKPMVKSSAKPGAGLVKRLGCRVSEVVSDVAADPLAQIAVVLVCVAWFALGLPVEVLTAFLSILAITLTQMVLNKQNEREADAHRRDVALHAKIDELVHASKRARDEIAGIEELEEEEIERLKNAVSQQSK